MGDQEQISNKRDLSQSTFGAEELPQLIADCIAQNRSSQKKLYEKYAPVVYGIIRRYIFSQSTAQEILNDTFYKVFTRLSQYSFTGSFEGWMRRIAVNTITDYLRKNMKHEQVVHLDNVSIEAWVPTDIIGKINYKDLLQTIHTLPDTQKTVFNLFVFEDMSHKEIGELLGFTENNCRWYLNDARKRLKEKIKALTS